jgi:hypothetical protein
MSLQHGLRALAERAPAPRVPAGLFDRARRRRRRRWTAAVAGVAVFGLATAGASLPASRGRQVADGTPGIPSTVVGPRPWTAEVAERPAGPASIVFTGPSVPGRSPFRDVASPTAVVGLTADTYRVVYPSQGLPALSPDGNTLLLAHLDPGGPDLRSRGWRTDALDLTSGRTRAYAAGYAPVGWSVDGRHVLLVQPDRWDKPDAPGEKINDMTVRVAGWPSGQADWSVHIGRADAVEGETNYLVALSPDGSMLAVSTSHELRVYQRDGALRWTRPLSGYDVLAGPAAWRPDGRLAVMRRSAVSNWYDPGRWTLAFVDAGTGAPLPDPGLPAVRSATAVQVVSWRGDTAYAVVRSQRHGPGDGSRASLVNLAPDAADPVTVVAPAGAENLDVAADYVAGTRTAGPPSFGLSWVGALYTVIPFAQAVVAVAAVVGVLWWARRRRRHRPIPPAP